MPSDKGNNDKTVFRQPSVNADRTVIRPMPGGRSGNPQASAQFQPTSTIQYQAQSQQQPQGQFDDQQQSSSAYFKTSSGLNPLVNAASTLIAVFEKTRQSLSHPDIGGLHQRLVNEIKAFEIKAKDADIPPEIILAARYVVCAALDETVLNTPWGAESPWPQRTLLSIFHNETAGGEKFFQILSRMLEQPSENLFILELMYIFLSLGFEGKYRVINRGRDHVEQLRDELYSTIRRQRGEYERSLSPSWQGLGKTRASLTSYIPMWVIVSIVVAVLLTSYSGFRVWLFDSSTPIVEKLDEIAGLGERTKK
jgi:type VI secretion system protein ImpK